jgi:hypothetical protein
MKTGTSLIWGAFLLASCTVGERYGSEASAAKRAAAELVGDQRIVYTDGLHNENTELAWFRGDLLLAFRGGGTGQTGTPDAHIEIFSSSDRGASFSPRARISMPDRDIRDPKLVVEGDRVVLYAISRVPGFQFRDLGGQAWTVRSESKDGVTWTAPVRVYDEGWGFWRFVRKDGVLYATGYDDGDVRVGLFASTDGVHWEQRGTITDSFDDVPSEAELRFFGERAVALVRLDNEGLVNDGQTAVCLADPPYAAWSCDRRLPERFDGPVWFGVKHGQEERQIVVARKHLPHTKKRTAVYELHGDLAKAGAPVVAEELFQLQSSGDTAYAAVARLDQSRYLLSWYSSPVDTDMPWLVAQFAPSDIWMAQLDFSKTVSAPPPDDGGDGGAPPPPTATSYAVDGTFLLSIAADFWPDPPFMFLAEVATTLAADGSGTMDATVQPLSTGDGQAVGEPWVLKGAPVSADGRIALAFGPQVLPAAANPVFQVDSLVDLTFGGFTVSSGEICGTVSGWVQQPVSIDVTGSPWGTAPVMGGGMPAARTTCP